MAHNTANKFLPEVRSYSPRNDLSQKFHNILLKICGQQLVF